MKTVVLGDPPPVLVSLFEERKRIGADTHDEIWDGEYHMAPAASFWHGRVQGILFGLLDRHATPLGFTAGLDFNLGVLKNFRVPDLGVHRGSPDLLWFDTAMIVVEVRSPDDETYDKFDFYFDHGVEEILVADLVTQTAKWFVRNADGFVELDRSDLLNISSTDVLSALAWPTAS
jgi:Uma2 family endonuclease